MSSRTIERAVAGLENAAALDPVVVPVQRVVRRLRPGWLKDLLSGVPAGHAAHPPLVVVPLGAFMVAIYLDLSGRESRAARRALLLALASAVPAVATGLSDWADTEGAERRVGAVHAVSNLTGVALGLSSWLARGSDAGKGRKRSMCGLGVLTVGGWLGGHLSYALGVGVDTTAFLPAMTEWTDVCSESDLIEGRPLGFTVAGAPIVVVVLDGEPHALYGRCTHRGAPLHEGAILDGCIECPWHGSRFQLADGRLERGPATRPQSTFETRVQDGRLLVRRAESRALRLNVAQ